MTLLVTDRQNGDITAIPESSPEFMESIAQAARYFEVSADEILQRMRAGEVIITLSYNRRIVEAAQ